MKVRFKNSKKKRNILILLILLIVLVVLIMVVRANLNKREVILNRVLEGMNNLNYTYYDKINGSRCTVKVYGKLEQISSTNDNITYNDYENKNTTILFPAAKFKESYSNNGIEDMKYYDFIKNYFNNESYNYKYKGKAKENGQKYTVVEFSLKEKAPNNKMRVIFWISDSTDVIYKEIYYSSDDEKRETIYNYTNGKNTIDIVKIPEEVYTEYSDETNG